MARREELTDEQWSLIEPLFDKPPVIATRGRPSRNAREVLNGVFWILRSGAHDGATCPTDFRHTKPATGVSSSGSKTTGSERC